MSAKRYTEEFKIEAVRQVTDRGYSVADVAQRLEVSTHSLYAWVKKYSAGKVKASEIDDAQQENQLLKSELLRVTEERAAFRQETLQAWEHYKETGKHVTMSEADAWLQKLEKGEGAKPPECHD